jgi:2-keto-3-deoxy-L-rhamnonate aldolase RhmA
MRINKFREKLNAGSPTLGTHIHTTWPSMVEAVGHAGMYDYVEFVGEYGPFDLHDLDNLARAGDLHDLSMMIKVDAENREYVAQRAVGSGFHSVLFADCRTPDEVRQCVHCVRPDTPEDGGGYGVASRRLAFMGYGGTPEYVQALRDIVVVMMIEKEAAVDKLEEMLSVEGVDMIQWGPADYSMSIGKAGERGAPEVSEAAEFVFKKAMEMGIPPRAEINSADDAKRFLDMGVKDFCIGTDVTILFKWWQDHGDAMRRALEGE